MIYHCMLVVFDEHIEWVLYAPIPDGVELFFVLSGFLIGNIFIKKYLEEDFGMKSIIEFWKNRWFRTLPAYFVVLAIIILVFYIKEGRLPHFTKYIFFIKTFLLPQSGIFPEAWSLAVEEWFYLSMPVFVFLLHKFLKNYISK